MKKLIFNEDGTLKVINVIILIDIIVAIGLLFMVKNIYGSLSNTTDIKRKTTTTKTTTTIDLCNGCKVNFKSKEMDVSPNNTYLLDELMALEKVNINHVKFTISDEKLAKIGVKDDRLALEVLDTLGTFTLKASYYTEEAEITINIKSDKVMDINIERNIYYIKKGEKELLKYDIIPKGFKTDNINVKSENENIASIEEGYIVGKEVGKTNIVIETDGITKKVPVYIVNSQVTLKVKENFLYRDLDKATYNGADDIEVLLILEDESKTNNDITYEVISDEDMTVEANYIKKNSEYPNAYEYTLKIGTNDKVNKTPRKGATVIFSLSDGSKVELRIDVDIKKN